MADISISTSAHAAQVSNPVPPPSKSATHAQNVLPADSLQLSSDARRHMEMAQGGTIAEAFLKHIIESPIKNANPTADQNLDEDEAKRKMAEAMERVIGDIGWLIKALGLDPVEAAKINNALAFQAGRDTATAQPPVAQVIGHARASQANVAVFVQQLSFLAGRTEVQDVAVERVSVTPVNASVAQQLMDKSIPRVVVIAESEHEGAEGSAAAFNDPDSIAARLAAIPSQELHGMLIVRETASTDQWRRVRVDALALVVD